MIYIIEIYTPGLPIDTTTASYIYVSNKIKAFTIALNYKRCHGLGVGVNVYEAINEYTNKTTLIKAYE